MPIVARGEHDAVVNYCEAVNVDPKHHPLQPASRVLPPNVFMTANDLYRYSICSYDSDLAPLGPETPAENAKWIIFDNVYCRTNGGRRPDSVNEALRACATAAGFVAKGGRRDPERGSMLLAGTFREFGRPDGFA